MYAAVVLLTMLVLPALSMTIDHGLHPDLAVIGLLGRWFVFWGMGVRLGLAGARQLLQPAFTAREIFHATGEQTLIIVQELGVANLAAAVIGLLSLGIPTFVVPAAVYGIIFYGAASCRHVANRDRSTNENIAMASDLFIALIFAVVIAARVGA
jgi:hypothetical protein